MDIAPTKDLDLALCCLEWMENIENHAKIVDSHVLNILSVVLT